jgi:hypothetical protein
MQVQLAGLLVLGWNELSLERLQPKTPKIDDRWTASVQAVRYHLCDVELR